MTQPRDDNGQFRKPTMFDKGHGPLSSADERKGGLLGGLLGGAAGFSAGGPGGALVGFAVGYKAGEELDDK